MQVAGFGPYPPLGQRPTAAQLSHIPAKALLHKGRCAQPARGKWPELDRFPSPPAGCSLQHCLSS